MKLKLKPSAREKRHYLLIEFKSKKKLNSKKKEDLINNSILDFIGTLGYSLAGPLYVNLRKEKLSKILQEKNLAVLSVKTKFVKHIKSALLLSKEKTIKMSCIRVSGTLKKLRTSIEK